MTGASGRRRIVGLDDDGKSERRVEHEDAALWVRAEVLDRNCQTVAHVDEDAPCFAAGGVFLSAPCHPKRTVLMIDAIISPENGASLQVNELRAQRRRKLARLARHVQEHTVGRDRKGAREPEILAGEQLLPLRQGADLVRGGVTLDGDLSYGHHLDIIWADMPDVRGGRGQLEPFGDGELSFRLELLVRGARGWWLGWFLWFARLVLCAGRDRAHGREGAVVTVLRVDLTSSRGHRLDRHRTAPRARWGGGIRRCCACSPVSESVRAPGASGG